MTSNIMEQYIKNTTVFIKNFTKMFFGQKYNEDISNEYISTYIEARIYNYGDETHRFFYRRIYASLIEKKQELQKKDKKIDEEILEENLKLYQFVFYFDGVRTITDIDELIKTIIEKRTTRFNLDETRGLGNRILKLYKQYVKEQEDFLKQFETEDFSLSIEKYILIDETYKVDIDYNFKIPYIYSNKVINEVYNSGIVNEDKLIIEYILLTLVCINDIYKGNFATKYIVNFASTLLGKQGKLKQTLKVLYNAAIQDKVFLKMNYSDYEDNKEMIYDLIKEGFKFAIVIDDTFNPTKDNYKKLSVFDYLLVPQNSKHYEDIKESEKKLVNTIIYDI